MVLRGPLHLGMHLGFRDPRRSHVAPKVSINTTVYRRNSFRQAFALTLMVQMQSDGEYWSFGKFLRRFGSWLKRGLLRLMRCLQTGILMQVFRSFTSSHEAAIPDLAD